MRKLFIAFTFIEIILCIIILNYFPDSVYITPLYYIISASIFILTLILALTYYAEYTLLKNIHCQMKYYIVVCKNSKDKECILIRHTETHKTIYNKEVDYINPNLIESLLIQIQPFISMDNYIQFVSDDFKLQVPKTCDDIPGFLSSYINQPYLIDKYIYDEHGDNWIRFINVKDPQDTITFTKQEQL